MFRQNSQTSEKMSFNEAVARFFLFPAFVSPPLFVLETLVSDLQFKRVWFSAFRGNSKAGIGIISAYMAGLIKGGSCGVKEPLAETYEMIFCATKKMPQAHLETHQHSQEKPLEIKKERPLLVNAAVPTTAAFVDTLFTNATAVTRFRAYDHKKLPKFNSAVEIWNYCMAGFWSRGCRANVGLFVLMYGRETTGGFVQKIFPEENYGLTGKAFQCAGLGFFTSGCTNPPDYLWKSSMFALNEQTYRIPSYSQTIQKIIKEQGVRAFMRGTVANSCSLTTMFVLVEGAEYILDNIIFPKNKTALQSNSVFNRQPPVGSVETDRLTARP